MNAVAVQELALSLAAPVRAGLGERVLAAALFGSVARGEATDASDIDVLLVLRPPEQPTRALYRLWDESIAPALPARVSPHFVAYPAALDSVGGLWFEVAQDGIVLWDEQGRLADVLHRLRASVAAGEVRRHVSHGHPYWVRTEARP